MKLSISASALAIMFAAATSADSLTSPPVIQTQILGTAPSGKHWIWLNVTGPRNHPLPVLYISTVDFKTTGIESLIILPQSRFDIVAKFTQLRITRPDCPNAGSIPREFTVQVIERDGGPSQMCALPQASACEYFSDIKNLPDMNWTEEDLQPINNFASLINCKRG
jgi:hypothetical protein